MDSAVWRRALAATIGLLLVGNASALIVLPRAHVAFRGAPAAWAPLVPQLMAFVERSRGLEFKRTVVFETLTSDDFAQQQGDGPTKDELAEYLTQETAFYQALGMVPLGEDLVDLSLQAIQKRIGGVYDSKSDRLLMRDDAPSPLAAQILVHELTHALDDQQFSLYRPNLYVHADEAGVAFDALIEGDASWVEQRFVDAMSDADREAARVDGEARRGVGPSFAPAIEAMLSFPYAVGAHFVAALHKAGGAVRVNAAFRSPPTTSAQVLEPDRFLSGGSPTSTPSRPKPDGASFRRGNLGELTLHLMVIGTSGTSVERGALSSWEADRYVAYTTKTQTCVTANVQTRGDATRMRSALDAWARSLPAATVNQQNDTIALSSCIPTPSGRP